MGGRTWRDFITKYDTIEMYDPAQGEWQIIGEFVDHRAVADAVVLNEQAHFGRKGNDGFSDSVFATELL